MIGRFIGILVAGLILLLCAGPVSGQQSFVNNPLEVKPVMPAEAGMEALYQRATTIMETHPDSAVALFRIYYQYHKMQFNSKGIAKGLLCIANNYLAVRGEPAKALPYLREAYPYCLQVTDDAREELLMTWSNDNAASFLMQGQSDSALSYLFLALATTKYASGNRKMLANIYYSIGASYYEIGNYNNAMPYLKKAQAIQTALRFNRQLVNTYYIFAAIYATRKEFDSSQQYMEKIKALQTYMSDNQKRELNMLAGGVYYHQSMPEKAIENYKVALLGYNVRDKVGNLNGMGGAYFMMKDYKKAIYYFNEALEVCKAIGIRGYQLSEIYNNLSEANKSVGNYKNAYEYKAWAAALNDSLNKANASKKLYELEGRFQTSQKDKELTARKLQLALAEADLRTKNIWIGSSMAGVLILLISIVILFQKQRLQLQRAKIGHQLQRVEQLKAVIDGEEKERSRIGHQLHDDIMVHLSIVKMSLNALPLKYSVIKNADDYRKIVQQLDYASQKVRQTAHNLMPDGLLEEGLISAVNYFCSNVALMSQVRVNFQHYGTIPRLPSDTEVSIYRIIQELVQNIIKHSGAANALVELSYQEHTLSITVEDDGIGFQPDKAINETKMGLKSIRTRIRALNGTMNIYQCQPHGTSVNIEITT